VEAWMPFDDETARRDTLFRWFGSEDKDFRSRTQGRQKGYRPPDVPPGIDTKAGDFIFFDALPVAPVPLKCDVMAPHMGKWYEQGDEITDVNTQPECIPADWHDPVPVYFLVADGPKLQFAIAPRTASARAELTAILDALDNALQSLGAGAKTAAGYGLMDRQITAEDGIRQALRQRDAEQERQRLERVRAAEEIKRREAARATMSPIELAIDELLQARTDKSQSEISAVIAAVKQGKWQGADRRVVAAWLKSRMEASPGQWKPQSHARRPEKDKEHQNTLLVLGWLLEGGV
jgi:CRISPR-associated protein Cmr6